MDLEIDDIKPDLSLLAEFINNIDEGDIENLGAFDLANLIVPKHRRDDGGEQNYDYDRGYRDGYLDASKANSKHATSGGNYSSTSQSSTLKSDHVAAHETPTWITSKLTPNNDTLRKLRLAPAVAESQKSIIVCFKNIAVNGSSSDFKKKKLNHLTPALSDSISVQLNSLKKPRLQLQDIVKSESYVNRGETSNSKVGKKLIVTRRNVARPLKNSQCTENADRNHRDDNRNEIIAKENVLDNSTLIGNLVSINELKSLRDSEGVPAKENDDANVFQNSDDEGTLPCSHVSEHNDTDNAEVKNGLDESYEDKIAVQKSKRRLTVKSTSQQCHLCSRVFTSVGRLKQHKRSHSIELKLCGNELTEELITNANDDPETGIGIDLPVDMGLPVAEKPIDSITLDECVNNAVDNSDIFTEDSYQASRRSHACPICNLTYRTKGHLRLHFLRIHETSDVSLLVNETDAAATSVSQDISSVPRDMQLHSCPMCSKMFMTKGYVRHHVARVHKIQTDRPSGLSETADVSEHDGRPYKCSVCNGTFRTKRDLRHHAMRVHATEKLKCTICPKVFSSRFKLRRHAKLMHTNDTLDQMLRRYLCQQCDAKFCTPQGLKHHLNRHDSLRPFCCTECNARFTTQLAVTEHARKHSLEKEFQCTNCSKRFTWLRSLRLHQSICLEPSARVIEGEQLRMACDVCGKRFKTEGRLMIHKRQHTQERPFPCKLCPKAFTCAEHLNSHRRKQHGLKKWACEFCQKKYATRSRMRDHMRVHSDERPYACVLCSASFKSLLALKDHNNRHAGIKPHVCSYCPGRFTTYSEMAEHMRTHNNLREFVCETCGRSYNRQKHLVVHRTVHTGEKRFPCSRCGKFFRRSMQLRIHMRTHTGEQPYHCKVCNRRFAQCGRFKSHLLTHTGEKPFQCTMCEWAFCRKDKLVDHQRRIHKINPVLLKSEGELLNDTVLSGGH